MAVHFFGVGEEVNRTTENVAKWLERVLYLKPNRLIYTEVLHNERLAEVLPREG